MGGFEYFLKDLKDSKFVSKYLVSGQSDETLKHSTGQIGYL